MLPALLIYLFLITPSAFYLGKIIFKKTGPALGLTIAIVLSLSVFLFRPVCKPITHWDTTVGGEIEKRSDRSFYMKVFQQKDGQWHHCKTWIARLFFF
jgi:hypothetical protein